MNGDGFSIILPTRGRSRLLGRFFDSVLATTRRPERLEVVLYVDEDDTESRQIDRPELRLIKHVGPRTTMGRMTRVCYQLSTEPYVFLANDDVVFRTNGWDEAVRSALECFADGVALVYGNDLHQGERVAAFPILPRPTCELIGSICPAGYVHDYIDVHILDIFLQLNRRGHDRVRYLPEVVFEHMHPEAGKGAPGVSYDGRSAAADEMLFIAWAEERKYLACRLAGHIQAGARRPAPPK